jgi:hypothetical protein
VRIADSGLVVGSAEAFAPARRVGTRSTPTQLPPNLFGRFLSNLSDQGLSHELLNE